MVMTTKTIIGLTLEESDILAKANDILSSISKKLDKVEGDVCFEEDDDARCVEDIAGYTAYITDKVY